MIEIYKDIQGYEGYQVSNHGNVRSLKYNKERILKPQKVSGGYLQVILCKEGKKKNCYVHRLVAQAFIDNPQNLPQVNHKDENPANNCVENLEFCDAKYNNNFGTRTEKSIESNTNHPNKSKQVLCVETGKIYPSTSEVQRQLGFSKDNIASVCRCERKQAYGYHWKYVS